MGRQPHERALENEKVFEMTKDRIQRFDNAMAVMPLRAASPSRGHLFLTWTAVWGIPATLFSLAGLYFALKRKRKSLTFSAKSGKKARRDSFAPCCGLYCRARAGLCSEYRHHMRNAIFSDLVNMTGRLYSISPRTRQRAPPARFMKTPNFRGKGRDHSITWLTGFRPLSWERPLQAVGEGAGMILANAALIIWTFAAPSQCSICSAGLLKKP